MKRKMLLLILVLIVLPIVASAASVTPTPPGPTPQPTNTESDRSTGEIESLAGSTVLKVSLASLDPNPPKAGDIVDVRIGVENKGGSTIEDLMLQILPEYPFEPVEENIVKDVGIVEGYRVDSTANIKSIKFRLKINEDVPAGSYELKVKYWKIGSSDSVTKSFNIDIKSRTNVEIIHISKMTLDPGNISDLKFKINNVGNAPIRDITFNWENKDNAILPVGSDNTRYIKYIGINDSYDLEYQVIADTNAKQGLYKLELYLSYTDSLNGTVKQLSSIAGVYIGGGTDFDVAFSENTNGESSFSIANIGSNPAYAVLISIPNQKTWKVSESNSVMIGNLNSGDYTSASFKLQPINNSQNTQTKQEAVNNSSDLQMRISYTDTMGIRKVVDKEIKLEPQNIATESDTKQGKQGNTSLIYIIIIVVIFIVLYQYKKQKTINPAFKMTDLIKKGK